MFDLQGAVCLVTGASGYIGAQVCRGLVEQGATVIAFYHEHLDRLEAVRSDVAMKPRIEPIQLDINNSQATAAVISGVLGKYGKIDVLVCAAGMVLRKSALLTGPDDCDRILQLNFKAVTQICRTVLRPMFRQSSGRIILIGSTAGERGLVGGGGKPRQSDELICA